jgi:hypothetical protein
MKRVLFSAWDWELDLGLNPLSEGVSLPTSYATASYDHLGRLYRVEIIEPKADAEKRTRQGGTEVYFYDYFCDASGRVIQKRSLGVNSEVELIVDYEYDQANSQVTETAWWPGSGQHQSRKRPIV